MTTGQMSMNSMPGVMQLIAPEPAVMAAGTAMTQQSEQGSSDGFSKLFSEKKSALDAEIQSAPTKTEPLEVTVSTTEQQIMIAFAAAAQMNVSVNQLPTKSTPDATNILSQEIDSVQNVPVIAATVPSAVAQRQQSGSIADEIKPSNQAAATVQNVPTPAQNVTAPAPADTTTAVTASLQTSRQERPLSGEQTQETTIGRMPEGSAQPIRITRTVANNQQDQVLVANRVTDSSADKTTTPETASATSTQPGTVERLIMKAAYNAEFHAVHTTEKLPSETNVRASESAADVPVIPSVATTSEQLTDARGLQSETKLSNQQIVQTNVLTQATHEDVPVIPAVATTSVQLTDAGELQSETRLSNQQIVQTNVLTQATHEDVPVIPAVATTSEQLTDAGGLQSETRLSNQQIVQTNVLTQATPEDVPLIPVVATTSEQLTTATLLKNETQLSGQQAVRTYAEQQPQAVGRTPKVSESYKRESADLRNILKGTIDPVQVPATPMFPEPVQANSSETEPVQVVSITTEMPTVVSASTATRNASTTPSLPESVSGNNTPQQQKVVSMSPEYAAAPVVEAAQPALPQQQAEPVTVVEPAKSTQTEESRKVTSHPESVARATETLTSQQLATPAELTAAAQPELSASAASDSRSNPGQHILRGTAAQHDLKIAVENVQPRTQQNVSVKEMTTAPQGILPAGESANTESSLGREGEQTGSNQQSSNQGLTPSLFTQQKTEHQLATAAKAITEPARPELPEQIAQQVRERLTQHDLKPGHQQISLTLSPDNLGEVKMNLTLQGQRLSVEIVTDNRIARDAIMQHADTLKETLARQNITMDSFDVTTGGKGSGGNQGQNQNAWQELAKKQQQQQLWTTSPRGYATAQADLPSGAAAYQSQKGRSMLDIHY